MGPKTQNLKIKLDPSLLTLFLETLAKENEANFAETTVSVKLRQLMALYVAGQIYV
jgi:hypothetical protein